MSQKTRFLSPIGIVLALAACGGGGPIGTFGINYVEPPPDLAPLPRLSVSTSQGPTIITDRLLDNEACTWLYNKGCELRCFPNVALYPACDDDREIFYYTQQGLTTQYLFGRVANLADPSCWGETTYSLVELTFIPDAARKINVYVCGSRNQSLSPSVHDRNWYTAKPATILPASAADLPPGSPAPRN